MSDKATAIERPSSQTTGVVDQAAVPNPETEAQNAESLSGKSRSTDNEDDKKSNSSSSSAKKKAETEAAAKNDSDTDNETDAEPSTKKDTSTMNDNNSDDNDKPPPNPGTSGWGMYPNSMVYFDGKGVRHNIHIPTGTYHRCVQLYIDTNWEELGKFPVFEGQKYTKDDYHWMEDFDYEEDKRRQLEAWENEKRQAKRADPNTTSEIEAGTESRAGPGTDEAGNRSRDAKL